MKTSSTSTGVQLPRDRKSLRSRSGRFIASTGMAFAFLVASGLTASATVLDNFNDNTKTGWTDTLNGGGVTEAGAQFVITPPASAGVFTFSTKTSQAFTNVAVHTVELKVLVNSIFTNSVTTNGHAVLGWVTTGGALGTNGYSLSVGRSDIQIKADTTVLYSTNLATNLPSADMFLALRMTPSGSDVIVKTTVYKKGDGINNVVFEHTDTHSSGYIGSGGNAALGTLNDSSGQATSVSFDDLQYFDTIRVLVDDFSGDYPGTGWQDQLFGTGNNSVSGGQLVMVGSGVIAKFDGALRADKTFRIDDGGRLEFRVDVVDATADSIANFLALTYAPNGAPDLVNLGTYHIAEAPNAFYCGKVYNGWWVENYTNSAPATNFRLILTMTGEGSSVRIEERHEDLSVGVNDPLRVRFQVMHVDSANTYIGRNGFFAIGIYNAAGITGGVTWDNVEVNKVITTNDPPTISGLFPANGKNFVASTNVLAFDLRDDVNVPLTNFSFTINGVVYTNGSSGVTVTPGTAVSTNRHVAFSGLADNILYKMNISVSDNNGASNALTGLWEFDTFLTNNFQVEAEDYNYADAGVGGQFIDGGAVNAYQDLVGTNGIDYNDNRGGAAGSGNHPYRPGDRVRGYGTIDGPRDEYVNAAQGENQIIDVRDGDWLNYTRTFPAGTYKVYLRESAYLVPNSIVTLSRVTSDRTLPGQTTIQLGTFLKPGDAAGNTGYDFHKHVLLTDTFGNPVIVRFTGAVDTLRLTASTVRTANGGDVFWNYMVFIPTPDPGTLRPVVTATSPLPGITSRQTPAAASTVASVVNRDTSVSNSTVVLKINGSAIATTITSNAIGGIDVAWTFLSLPTARAYTNTLVFADTAGVSQTNTWTYSYPFLAASNIVSSAVGARGFAYRMLQSSNNGNNLGHGIVRQLLLIPPPIPYDKIWSTNVQTLAWSDDNGVPKPVPGLDNGISGYVWNGTSTYNNIATESLGYMQLTAGPHRWTIVSDDGFLLRSGATPSDLAATVLCFRDGGTFGGTFDFVVETNGLYSIYCNWYENGGGAYFYLYDDNGNYVNDPGDPAGVVRVFRAGTPPVILGSSTANGPYTPPAGAVIDYGTQTATVPILGSPQFFRLQAGAETTLLKIKTITVVGGNFVITYQYQ